jgi:hypothetical protein
MSWSECQHNIIIPQQKAAFMARRKKSNRKNLRQWGNQLARESEGKQRAAEANGKKECVENFSKFKILTGINASKSQCENDECNCLPHTDDAEQSVTTSRNSLQKCSAGVVNDDDE